MSQSRPRLCITILGDFNLSAISSQYNSCGSLLPIAFRSTISPTSRKLLAAYCTAGLRQPIGIVNENFRRLDLCFVTEELRSVSMVIQAPSSHMKACRYHSPVLLKIGIGPQKSFHDGFENVFYDIRYTDFNGLNRFFSHVD